MVSDCSDLEPENKKIKCEDESTEEEIPSFYSYKSARPIVKSLCLSSPGLCSPRKPVTRNGRLPQDLKEILEQKLVDVKDDADSSDEEFEESSFLTPLGKKTKCLSSPGLCNNFPKVTKRSFPSSIGKLIDEAQELEERFESTYFEEIDAHSSDEEFDEHSPSTECTSEENGNSIFDLEVRFSKPKDTKTKCLSSPGLCESMPVVTKRSYPVSLEPVLEEELSGDIFDEDYSELSFTTTQTIKTKCTRTPGLCELFPQVTSRSFPSSLTALLDEDLIIDDLANESMQEEEIDYENLFENKLYDDSDYSEDEDSLDGDSTCLVDQVTGVNIAKASSKCSVPAEVVEDLKEQVVSLSVPAEVVEDLIEQVLSQGSSSRQSNKPTKKFRISVANRPKTSISLL